ncbi:MAG TPA: hypothetical protein VNM67_15010 [Thermoanaerobaculia bacterium]|jgi:hypothetical protein|nr:hypothetical protein [Thermoanaerobaculia bacterium]
MSKLTKIAIGSVGFWIVLTLLHAWLNLGIDPASLLRKKTGVAEKARFRVGFLPVT